MDICQVRLVRRSVSELKVAVTNNYVEPVSTLVGIHHPRLIVYIFLIMLLRLTGKRQIGQMAPFDLVLLLVLSNAVQNAMNGGDNSVLSGIISAVTLVAVNWLVGLLTYKSKRMEALVEGRPEVLIHNGS